MGTNHIIDLPLGDWILTLLYRQCRVQCMNNFGGLLLRIHRVVLAEDNLHCNHSSLWKDEVLLLGRIIAKTSNYKKGILNRRLKIPDIIIQPHLLQLKWLHTSARNRLNIAASSNYSSKLGIMSNSESTGSYHLNDRFFSRSNRHGAEEYSNGPHLVSSTSAIDVSKGVHHSHHYMPKSPGFSRKPLMRRFIHDGHGEWSDEDEPCTSLV